MSTAEPSQGWEEMCVVRNRSPRRGSCTSLVWERPLPASGCLGSVETDLRLMGTSWEKGVVV